MSFNNYQSTSFNQFLSMSFNILQWLLMSFYVIIKTLRHKTLKDNKTLKDIKRQEKTGKEKDIVYKLWVFFQQHFYLINPMNTCIYNFVRFVFTNPGYTIQTPLEIPY